MNYRIREKSDKCMDDISLEKNASGDIYVVVNKYVILVLTAGGHFRRGGSISQSIGLALDNVGRILEEENDND